MLFALSLSPEGNSFELHTLEDPEDKKEDPDFSLLKQASACKTYKEVFRFLSSLPSECTEYNNINFWKTRTIVNQEGMAQNDCFEPCSVQEMQKTVQDKLYAHMHKGKSASRKKDLMKTKEIQQLWDVACSKKATKQISHLDKELLDETAKLIHDLKIRGPYLTDRSHFCSLHQQPHIPKNAFHCHINDGNPTYVACWNIVEEKKRKAEIFFVGTHEKAPYTKN